jgi:hypothetical protein
MTPARDVPRDEDQDRLLEVVDRWGQDCPHIPRSVTKHARVVVSKSIPCSLLRSLREDPGLTSNALERTFRRAGQILDAMPEEVVQATDWSPNDLDPNRFDAMLAELRAIVFLDDEGFSSIRLLASKGHKKADGTAMRGETKYAVEVACCTTFKHPPELAPFVAGKYNDKRDQLEATAQVERCDGSLLVLVFVDLSQTALVTRNDNLEAGIKPAWQESGLPMTTHMAVVAHPDDNCVFPPWVGDTWS